MTEATKENAEKPKKGKLGIILIILGILIAGGGGVAVGYLGMIPAGLMGGNADKSVPLPSIENTIFIKLPPITIPLGQNAKAKHLRAVFSLETDSNYEERIEKLRPRLMDMLNTYLRAVEEKELTNPERFQNLQAQMLRRARLVAGESAIKNLLVQEFILQ
ncbi:MAG: flagellar FliL protein [Alphaproteobacteria bacterium]|jgi:flagellar FliL protein